MADTEPITAPAVDLRTLAARCENAAVQLDGLAKDAGSQHDRIRLRGKAQGVRLAKSYIEDLMRGGA